jgi:16S rRNA (guanine527-N7)-methyltransferase
VKRSAEDSTEARLRELAAVHDLDGPAVARMREVLQVIASDPRSPTSVTDPVEAADVHLADSLSALPLIDELAPVRIADVGSGAGFPGIPLSIARPEIEVDLVETTVRKCRFLEDLVAGLNLERVQVVHRRVEEWGREQGRERYDAVLVRAVGTLPMVLEYAAPLLRNGGGLIAWRGRFDAAPQAAVAAQIAGMELDRVFAVQPYPASRDRHLRLYRRVRPVPDSLPRRPGMARKRPLGR